MIFLEICNSYKIVTKGLYVKKDYCTGNLSTEIRLFSNSVYKKMLIEQFDKHLPHFLFKFDFVNFCNSNIEDFQNLFYILILGNIPGFTEKNT